MDTPEKIAQMREAIFSVDSETLTQVFELKYAVAKEVEAALSSRLDAKGIGSVKADERSNRVIVTALPGKMTEIEKIIAELDQKTREVLIEAKIVKVTLDDDYDMGIDWQAIFREGKKASIDFAGTFPVASTVTSFGRVTAGVLSRDDYSIALKLLKNVGETHILSSPRIAAIHNQEAKILVGSKEAYVTQSVTQGTSTTTTASSVTFIDVGVQLYVTPQINKDGYVTMKIRPEVSSVGRTLTTSTGDQIPIVDTAMAETRVMVKDGYTIIIGGLIQNEASDNVNKVPRLGDIPLVGNAFKKKTERFSKSELVVFLTPHIITGNRDDQEALEWQEEPFTKSAVKDQALNSPNEPDLPVPAPKAVPRAKEAAVPWTKREETVPKAKTLSPQAAPKKKEITPEEPKKTEAQEAGSDSKSLKPMRIVK
jgi:general secretion pathway protein D